jgi:hypothetical protein
VLIRCARFQVPRFELYETKPMLSLTARKTSSTAVVSSSLGVLGFNVLGPGGIGSEWQTNGLAAPAIKLQCSPDLPPRRLGDPCAVIWLQSPDCSTLGTSHINVSVGKLTPAVATLDVSGAPRSLHEGRHNFSMHVPVWNGTDWRYLSIAGAFDVTSVACASSSQLVLQESRVISHLEFMRVKISARDVDGFLIDRPGERITVMVQLPDGSGTRVPTQFEKAADSQPGAGQYVAVVDAVQHSMHGEYKVFACAEAEVPSSGSGISSDPSRTAMCPTGSTSGNYESYTVVCASGSRQDGGRCAAAVDWKHAVVGSAAGLLLLGMIRVMVYLAYAHRDRVKDFLQSFFKHEVVLVLKSAFELWGASKS